jgi:hypothetical protein
MRIGFEAAGGTADRPHVLGLALGTKALVTLPEVFFLQRRYVDIVRRSRWRAPHTHSPKLVAMMIFIINGVVY